MPFISVAVLMFMIPLAMTLGASFMAELISGARHELGHAARERPAPTGPAVAA